MRKKANLKEILDKGEGKYLISTNEGEYVLVPLFEYYALKRSQKSGKNLTEKGLVDRINRDIAHASLEDLELATKVKWEEEEEKVYLEPIEELLKN